jgi:cytochrome c oxidase cbb3-type subunit 3
MFLRSLIPDPRLAALALGVAVLGAVAGGIRPSHAADTTTSATEPNASQQSASPPPVGEHAPTVATDPLTVPTTTLYPGGQKPPPPDPHVKQYEGNAQEIASGKMLFDAYNCSGCHFHGAGGMGPPFMNKGHWIYGGRLDQIFASIFQGRPNGMPSWGNKLAPQQIWSIAAYVKSLSLPDQNKEIDVPPPPAPQ